LRAGLLLMERQRQASASPAVLWMVLDEVALRHQVGGPRRLRGQIEHLIELTAQPGTFVQVVPFSSGVRMSMDASFTIMEFPDPADPDVVCVGYPTGLLWIEDTTEVAQYNALFRHLQAAALSLKDSDALMTSLLRDV
jgi:hypothetical protein